MKHKNFKSIAEMVDYINDVVKTDKILEVPLKYVTVEQGDSGFCSSLGGVDKIPLCNMSETLKSFFERSGQTMEANKRLSIDSQIEVMNTYCFPSFKSDAMGKAIIREDEIIALHSSRYAYINQHDSLKACIKALTDKGANIEFVRGSYSPLLTELTVCVNHEDLLKDYIASATRAGLPPIIGKGAYITFEYRTNDVGTCEVSVVPKLNVAGHSIYLDEPYQRKHKDITSHRACDYIYDGTASLFMTAREEVRHIGELMNIKIYDAEKTVDKCIKYLKLKKLSVSGTEQFLNAANYVNVQNAFQVYVLIHDFLKTDAISNSSKEYKERCSRTIRKLVAADWSKLK